MVSSDFGAGSSFGLGRDRNSSLGLRFSLDLPPRKPQNIPRCNLRLPIGRMPSLDRTKGVCAVARNEDVREGRLGELFQLAFLLFHIVFVSY